MYPDPKDQLQPFLTQSAHSYTLNPEEPDNVTKIAELAADECFNQGFLRFAEASEPWRLLRRVIG